MCGCNTTSMVSYVGDEDFVESFLGNKKKKAARQEKRAAKKTARIEKRVEKKTNRIEKRSAKKADRLENKAAKAKNPGRAAILTARADRKLVKADSRIAKKQQVGENRVMRKQATANVRIAKNEAGKGGLFGTIASVLMPGPALAKAVVKKAIQKPAAAPKAQLEEVRNPVSEVANLSTPLTPTTSMMPAEADYSQEDIGLDEPFDQPTSGWDAEAQAVSDQYNEQGQEGYEEEGYEEEGYEEEMPEEGYEEEMYEEELSFTGKLSPVEQKKKNHKVVLSSLVALIGLCLVVWFVTKFIKKK